jgi:hypothetical protein
MALPPGREKGKARPAELARRAGGSAIFLDER